MQLQESGLVCESALGAFREVTDDLSTWEAQSTIQFPSSDSLDSFASVILALLDRMETAKVRRVMPSGEIRRVS